jgi:hypothetical protein
MYIVGIYHLLGLIYQTAGFSPNKKRPGLPGFSYIFYFEHLTYSVYLI